MRTNTGPALGRLAAWSAALFLLVAAGIAGVFGSASPAAAATCVYTLGSGTVALSVTEGATTTITVTRSGTCGPEIVQLLPTSPGGAGFATLTGPNADITFSATGASFDENDTSSFALVGTLQDLTLEGNETFTLTLSNPGLPGSILGGTTSATVTILDDDGPPSFSFSVSDYPITEGVGSVQVTVNRSGAVGQTVSVQYSTIAGSAASPGDFTAIAPTTLMFGPTENAKVFNVAINDDGTPESSEQFFVHLSGPSGGGSVGSDSTITITDNDGPGTPAFSATSYNVTESSGTAQILLTRTGGTTGTVSLTCAWSAGTATNGIDFNAGSMVVSFANGETQSYCNVPILNDSTPESQETVALALSCPCSGVGAPGSPSSATLYIDDDDGTGTIAFSASSYAGTENGGPITITVTRASGTGSGSVTYTASTGSAPAAIAGTDFFSTTGTLTWGVGDFTSRTFTVTPIDDNLIEGAENILLTLSAPTGGLTLGSPSTATIVLSDNESPLPTITSVSPSSGTILGGTAVTIAGSNFSNVQSVTFGGLACSSVNVVSVISLTCVTPPHVAGTVDVVVTTLAGSNSTAGTANDYTYTGGPTITSLNPATGPASGNTIVTITGTNFTASGMVVKFDTTTAVFSYIDTTTIVAVAPAHSAGTVNVSVTTPGGTSPDTVADDYIYTGSAGPVISLLSPASGPVGTTVIIAGSGFTGATLVTFGGVAATYTVNNDAQITASVPTGTPAGSVDVRVTTAVGTSPNTAADNFNNTSASPTITYTLYFRFTLIVWTGPNNISALAALKGQENPDNPATNNVSSLVGAIWRFDAATQTFKGYFPGSDGVPGANDFTTLTNGVGYFIALLNPGTVTWTTLGTN